MVILRAQLLFANTESWCPDCLHIGFGEMQDNPTSTTILDIDINSPSFSGVATYEVLPNAPATITDAMDQRNGDWVKQTNPSITDFATGTRNPYDVRVGMQGNVMVTINGPNRNFGAGLTGVNAQLEPITGPDPESGDAVYVDLKQVCFPRDVLSLATPADVQAGWMGKVLQREGPSHVCMRAVRLSRGYLACAL